MTRGRCDLLGLHRMELSSTTPRRFLPALRKSVIKKRLNLDMSLYTILQIISVTVFNKTPL